MPDLDARRREALAGVLAGHRQEHQPATGAASCACGAWAGPYTMVTDERSYAAHIADALAPLIAGWLAEAEAEALREAADAVPLFEFMLVMDIAAEVAPSQIGAWLRDRADRIGDTNE